MIIKKIFLVAFLVCATLTSCKNDKEEDLLKNNPTTEPTDPTTPDDQKGSILTLVLNEVCGLQDPDDDWVEIYNNSSLDVDIDGCILVKTDETGSAKTIYTAPAGTTIKAGEYKIVATLSGELSAGISNKKQIGIDLQSPSGTTISSFNRDSDVGVDKAHVSGGSYARIPNATGTWTIVTSATRGSANQ